MTLRLGGAALVLAFALATVAGCGGGDDRLSHEEFVKQGNAICAAGNEKIETAGATAFASAGQPTQDEIVTFARSVVVPTVQGTLDQIGELSPPEADETRVDAILGEAQSALDKLSANPALLAQEDEFDGFHEADRLANKGIPAADHKGDKNNEPAPDRP